MDWLNLPGIGLLLLAGRWLIPGEMPRPEWMPEWAAWMIVAMGGAIGIALIEGFA